MTPERPAHAARTPPEIPPIEGVRSRESEPLAGHSTFQIGGPARWFARIDTEDGLIELLAWARTEAVAFFILGLGSNVLFPDEGFDGVVARLGGDFESFEIDGTEVRVGAAVPLPRVAKRTASAGLGGLEALSGFPSTIGGAVYMNAGCYGTEICDVLREATIVGVGGDRFVRRSAELDPGYRRTNLEGTGAIVTRAVFDLREVDAATATGRIEEFNRKRWQSLPSGVANAGSIFRNPEGDFAGRMIDACGLKGLTRGTAQISERHGNVIVNHGGARADDVLELMLEARSAVQERFAVILAPEVVLTGDLLARWQAER